MRKEELVDAILARQGDETAEGEDQAPRRRRSRRTGRGRTGGRRAEEEEGEGEDSEAPAPSEAQPEEPPETPGDELVEGAVELLPGGSAFVRVEPPEPSDADVYVSAAQVKRCELVTGDRIAGPRRPPRRSERFASLVRIDVAHTQTSRLDSCASLEKLKQEGLKLLVVAHALKDHAHSAFADLLHDLVDAQLLARVRPLFSERRLLQEISGFFI